MKAVYICNEDKIFNGIKMVEDDYQPAENEFLDKPQDGLYEPIKRVDNGWVGTPKAVWEANQPKVEVKPTAQQQLNANVSLQLAQLAQAQKQQEKINAQLTLQNAQLAQQLKTNKEA